MNTADVYNLTQRERCSPAEIRDFYGLTERGTKQVIAMANREQFIARHPDVAVLSAWAAQFRHVTWQMVAEKFKVSRATAYRMLSAYRVLSRSTDCG